MPPPPWVIRFGESASIRSWVAPTTSTWRRPPLPSPPSINVSSGRLPRCRRRRRLRRRRRRRHRRRHRLINVAVTTVTSAAATADAEPVGRRAAALGVVVTAAVFINVGDQRWRQPPPTSPMPPSLPSSLDQCRRYDGCQRLRRCPAGCRSRRRPSARQSSALLFLIKQFFLISVASEAN